MAAGRCASAGQFPRRSRSEAILRRTPNSGDHDMTTKDTSAVVEGYALSRQQQRLWTVGRGDTIQIAGVFEGVGSACLRDAIEAAACQHEIFTARFCFLPGLLIPIQTIGAA